MCLIPILCALVASNAVDPDELRDAMGLISSKGYRAEQYESVTADGYKLTLHRIPCRRDETGTPDCDLERPVVFLQHGLLCSSTNWLTNLANQSLAYLLADAGFDVWLGNVRGNLYSRAHVNLDPSQPEFWAFSFDEFAKLDLPAMVDTALKVSGQKDLYYIGHSQGTMIGFIQFGEDPVLASKIKHFYALGPVATVGHIKGTLSWIAEWTRELAVGLRVFGVKEFLPTSWLFKLMAKTVCTANPSSYIGNPCENLFFMIAGYDSVQLNASRIPVYVAHSPSGTSSRDVIHFGQMVVSKKFQKFDFGWWKNRQIYGQGTPPEYDVSKMNLPVTLYWGEDDWLADPTDITEYLLPNLPNIQGNYKLKETNHLDLIWGLRVVETTYKPIISQLKAMEGMN